MFATSFIALAAVASFVVAAPVEQRGAPANWAYGYLEDYDTYHVRYLALKCYDQKKTDFFQDCCRPMLSTQTLANDRKAYCIPSSDATNYVESSLAGTLPSASVSAAAASESSAAAPAGPEVKVAAPSSSAAAASPAAASSAAAAVQYIAPAAASPSTTSTTPAYTPPAPTTTSTTPAYTPPAPAPTTQAPSNNGETFTGGFATYFFQGGNPGACGQYHADSDRIIAIDQARWGSSSFGGGSSTCGKWITVTNTKNGKSTTAMVADVCPTCVNGNSLDLSQAAFRDIANDADGMVPISWRWA